MYRQRAAADARDRATRRCLTLEQARRYNLVNGRPASSPAVEPPPLPSGGRAERPSKVLNFCGLASSCALNGIGFSVRSLSVFLGACLLAAAPAAAQPPAQPPAPGRCAGAGSGPAAARAKRRAGARLDRADAGSRRQSGAARPPGPDFARLQSDALRRRQPGQLHRAQLPHPECAGDAGSRQHHLALAAGSVRADHPQGPDHPQRDGDRPAGRRPPVHRPAAREQSRIGDARRRADRGDAARRSRRRRHPHRRLHVRRHAGALPLRAENFFYLSYGAPVRRFYIRQLWPTPSRSAGARPAPWSGRARHPGAAPSWCSISPTPRAAAAEHGAAPGWRCRPRSRSAAIATGRGQRDAGAAFPGAEQLPPIRRCAPRSTGSPPRPRIRAGAPWRRCAWSRTRCAISPWSWATAIICRRPPTRAGAPLRRLQGQDRHSARLAPRPRHRGRAGAWSTPGRRRAQRSAARAEPFNHVIVRARLDGRSYWLDGTRTGDRNLDDLASSTFGWGLALCARTAPRSRPCPTRRRRGR